MWYFDENDNLWLGDVQNMHGVAVDPEVEDYYEIRVYPNPFQRHSTISFSIKEISDVKLEIYNLKGQKIKTITNRLYNKGTYKIKWFGDDNYGNNVTSGVYFYRLNINGMSETIRKCLLVR